MHEFNFGIVQGRLIQCPPEKLQWFPQVDWEAEFFISQAIGINYVELIADRQLNPQNPLWSDVGIERILELVKTNSLTLEALCNDFNIDHCLADSVDVLQQNLELVSISSKLGIKKYIIPLFEKSELTIENGGAYFGALRQIASYAGNKGIIVCLETNLNGTQLISFLNDLNHPNIKIVYDTGNRISFGHKLAQDICLLGNRICHVHIKDKNSNNQNVRLGTGLVDFYSVFGALIEINYSGPYTFETHRGNNPVRTAQFNMEFVKYFFSEALNAI